MSSDYLFSVVGESELNELMAGRPAGHQLAWQNRNPNQRVPSGSFGVLCQRPKGKIEPMRPVALIVAREDHRRLFGRTAQLRGDLSPVSAWCHILTPKRFEAFDDFCRDATLFGYEAAWVGLTIAEAFLLSGRSVANLKLTACLATQSFAIGRAKSLWQNMPMDEVLELFDTAQHLFRGDASRLLQVRKAFEPIWATLNSVSGFSHSLTGRDLGPLRDALTQLAAARGQRIPDEAYQFALALRDVAPEARLLEQLPNLTPEQRVREFDRLVSKLDSIGRSGGVLQQQALAMLAGYLATVTAGGAPSLSLTESSSRRWPEILAWAYILGGVGEYVVWTSSFDGLGRLVARELVRPFRVDDPPDYDFALDEAVVLFDPQLSDPLVHLRIKQARVATVCIAPGVNILLPMGNETNLEVRASSEQESSRLRKDDPTNRALAVLADAIWPHLRERIENYDDGGTSGTRKVRGSRKEGGQSKLPLR